ncbi:glutamine synthetase family protein [Psychrobacter aestuarii]|uniref:Glutamine synthetase family protein n=1 Tax=Psychrobacter aestuarii TaxID=556327 RepID=A0ABP3FD45_9GAMM|nr:glutamine synthetase family protein [Psychrobacter aestuarii]
MLAAHGMVDTIRSSEYVYVAVSDINGILRGKRIPAKQFEKVTDDGIRLPLSVLGVDIWGADVIESSQCNGDIDAIAKPTGRDAFPLINTNSPSSLLPVWLFHESGEPYYGDARHVLRHIAEKFKALELTPVMATELEFYLLDYTEGETPKPPIRPKSGLRLNKTSVLSINDLLQFDDFLDDVYTECRKLDIPVDAALAENGCGQFEINLLHVNDPLKAADDAILFKQVVKAVAAKRGLTATFMAKPFGKQSGNGFHVHCSLLDKNGNNIFDDGSDEGSEILRQAVAGLVATMSACTLLFAPHVNSYRRFIPGTLAPNNISWGYENRTAAVRIPGGDTKARRIEHRVSGADANPYLVCSAVLAGILYGIENQLTPPSPINDITYDADNLDTLPLDWLSAIREFEDSDVIHALFPVEMIELLIAVKKQEAKRFAQQVTNLEYLTYLQDA